MRFRLCGGLEPPDWLLVEAPLLSRLSPRAAAGLCAAVGGDVAGDSDRAVAQAEELLGGDRDDGDRSAARAAVAALRFVLTSAAKYDLDAEDVRMELQQLGLDATLAAAIAQALDAARAAIREQLRAQSLAFARPEATACAVRRPSGPSGPAVEVRMRLSGPATALAGADSASAVEAFEVRADKFLALEDELRRALATLQSVRL